MEGEKVLIANRGEIACRIIRACRLLGLKSVAIYSTADKGALHVDLADEAYWVGDSPSQSSYLNIKKIIDICKRSGVKAVHPGYGFLAENANFALKVIKEDMIFVGPKPKTIKLLGDKIRSKDIAQKAGIPILPFISLKGDYSNKDIKRFAEKEKFPLLVKAAHGGGGKGMRKVASLKELESAIESARRESLASFNSDLIYVEKYVKQAKHIEVQVAGDRFGNYCHFFERDCSLQRRHQKLIEESPAPILDSKKREDLLKYAIRLISFIEYESLGTVEFLYTDKGDIYFLEVNSRLQVEHPVTEESLGVDLVALQLKLAFNGKLSKVNIVKHRPAIECRLIAESAEDNFSPSTGKIKELYFPEDIRVDCGYRSGDEVAQYYDSLLAKIIVVSDTRAEAIEKMLLSLDKVRVAGVKTNLPFLRYLLKSSKFAEGDYDINFAEDSLAKYIAEFRLFSNIVAVSCAYIALRLNGEDSLVSNFRLFNYPLYQSILKINGVNYFTSFTKEGDNYLIKLEWGEGKDKREDEQRCSYDILKGNKVLVKLESESILVNIHFISKDEGWFTTERGNFYLQKERPRLKGGDNVTGYSTKVIRAHLPGSVVKVMVKKGDKVQEGDPLIILESMKMEHVIYAPFSSKIKDVLISEKDIVQLQEELLLFE